MSNDISNDTQTAMDEDTTREPDAPAQISPSSSTPLAPGLLAVQLQDVFSRALSHTTKTCSYNNFAACFPTPAARRPDVLRNVWQQVVGGIETKARREFEAIMNEREVVKGLNELEGLVQEAKRKRQVWDKEGGERPIPPHTLPPDTLYGAHLAPQLEPIAKDLQVKIDTVSAENEQLAENITKQRNEVSALIQQLEAVVKDIEAANETLSGIVDEQQLRQQAIDVQNDLNGSKL